MRDFPEKSNLSLLMYRKIIEENIDILPYPQNNDYRQYNRYRYHIQHHAHDKS